MDRPEVSNYVKSGNAPILRHSGKGFRGGGGGRGYAIAVIKRYLTWRAKTQTRAPIPVPIGSLISARLFNLWIMRAGSAGMGGRVGGLPFKSEPFAGRSRTSTVHRTVGGQVGGQVSSEAGTGAANCVHRKQRSSAHPSAGQENSGESLGGAASDNQDNHIHTLS
ncbi:hypothetical protein ZHAS_00018984 [Anopheles sinensis]|uniref:Uncharacterized protein n=1 Tax=Anopheles sinensis TaxID=74873 RepID=A0A084WL50_ANOSI|nr:hypothetical protein ZHAS_00018984 [Anopheles sinensis]